MKQINWASIKNKIKGFWHRTQPFQHKIKEFWDNGVIKLWQRKFGPFIITFLTLVILWLIIRFIMPRQWLLFLSSGDRLAFAIIFILSLLFLAGYRLIKLEQPVAQKWETIGEIALALGTVFLAYVTLHHTQETSRIVEQIEQASKISEQARKDRISPRILIGPAQYDKDKMPKLVFIFIQNIGEGDAFDLKVAVTWSGCKATDVKDKYLNQCIFITKEETFSPVQLGYLGTGQSMKIPFDLSNLYKEEAETIRKDTFFFQKQSFKVYVKGIDIDEDTIGAFQELSLAKLLYIDSVFATEIEKDPSSWKIPNGDRRNHYQKNGYSDSLNRKSAGR